MDSFFNKIFNDAVDSGLIKADRKLENYFPRAWDRKAIEDNKLKFKNLLIQQKIVKNGDEASTLIDDMLDKKNELFSSHSILLTQSRAFKDLNDNMFEDFLTTDLNTAVTYYMNAANTIQHKKSFLLPNFSTMSNKNQFEERWLDPINSQLKKARGNRGLGRSEKKDIYNLYKSVTGQVNYFDSGLIQGIYDGTKLANAMAYLPLATVSSITEAMIPLTKTGGSPTGAIKDAMKGLQEGHKIFVQDIPLLLKRKHKMSDSQIQKEMNQVFLAMDEGLAESTNRLSGEGLQNEFLKKIGRGFFRYNMLTPWTKAVQLASFNVGKGMIRENLESLNKFSKEGIDIFDESKMMQKVLDDKRNKVKSTSNIKDIQKLKSELFDFNIDVADGLRWLDDGAKTSFGPERKNGVMTGDIKYEDEFYKSVVQGAGRFVNEVIMPVGRDRARIPTFMTHPKLDIFTQFLRYPTVFSNTVLKNYIRSTVVNPKVNGAKVGAFALTATSIALATNYWRSNEDNRDTIATEGFSKNDIKRAFQRVGLFGPLEYGVRFGDSIDYTKNPYVSTLSLGGPTMNDITSILLGRRGLVETITQKTPLSGTKSLINRTNLDEYLGGNPFDMLNAKARQIDKEINYAAGIKDRPEGSGRYSRNYKGAYTSNYSTGGLVKGKDDVPYTKDNPADRKNPRTGKPYSDQMARLGLSEGGPSKKEYKLATDEKLLNFILATEDFNLYKSYRNGDLDKVIQAHKGSKRFKELHGRSDVSTIGGVTNSGITEATVGQTVDMVRQSLRKFEDAYNEKVPQSVRDTMPIEKQQAMISLMFNAGAGAVGKSEALKNYNQGDMEGFYREAFDPEIGFTKVRGEDNVLRTDSGLQSRRRQELELAEGTWLDPYTPQEIE